MRTDAPLPAPAVDYLRYAQRQRRLAARTLTLYAQDLQHLVVFAQGVPLLELRSADIRRFVADMRGSGRSARGIALILSGWRGFYTWAVQEGLIAHHPLHGLRSPKAPQPLPQILPVQEAMQLADHRHNAQDDWEQARDAALIELLYSGGLRVGEVAGLDLSPPSRCWVDLEQGQAHVLGNGGKYRSAPIGPAAVTALRAWLALRPQPFMTCAATLAPQLDSQALFIGRRGARLSRHSIWARVRQRSMQAGLSEPVYPHKLRHSFASHILQSSSDLSGVQQLLGHVRLSTTEIYARIDFEHLTRAYYAAHPRAYKKYPDDSPYHNFDINTNSDINTEI